MATTRKVLGQAAPAAVTATDMYTAPASTSAVCSTLVIANRGTDAFVRMMRFAGNLFAAGKNRLAVGQRHRGGVQLQQR